MSLLCWTFQFIMQLFDMKTFFWNTAISFRHSVAVECGPRLGSRILLHKKIQITSSRRTLQADGRSLHFKWQVAGNTRLNWVSWDVSPEVYLLIYNLKSTDIYFHNLVIRQMEWEQFWRNEARQLAALHQGKEKKRSNKLFGWLHSLNAHIISVIFSPTQCCWCTSGCWWHAENVLHSFLCELVSKSLGGFLILLHQNRTRFP